MVGSSPFSLSQTLLHHSHFSVGHSPSKVFSARLKSFSALSTSTFTLISSVSNTRLIFKNTLVEGDVVRPMDRKTTELVERELRYWDMDKQERMDAQDI